MDIIETEYTNNIFENIKHVDEYKNEYWFARELSKVLEYKDWRNFLKVLNKAKEACENSGLKVNEQLVETNRLSKRNNNATVNIQDYKLSRYICYLIVQNADPSKEVVALGQTYFAIQTRKQEITEQEYDSLSDDDKRFYQKMTELYTSCSVDYDKDSVITKEFFKTVQNKLHYAITGNTAAEIIYNRVDSEKENMGLTNWKNSPDGPIYKYDVDIAKNYLNEKELKDLNRIVTMYLDYAELQAENHNAMTMKDWVEKLNAFLQFNGKEILHSAGKISASVAKELAYKEYDKFKVKQDKLYKSDFDNFLNETRMIENESDK